LNIFDFVVNFYSNLLPLLICCTGYSVILVSDCFSLFIFVAFVFVLKRQLFLKVLTVQYLASIKLLNCYLILVWLNFRYVLYTFICQKLFDRVPTDWNVWGNWFGQEKMGNFAGGLENFFMSSVFLSRCIVIVKFFNRSSIVACLGPQW